MKKLSLVFVFLIAVSSLYAEDIALIEDNVLDLFNSYNPQYKTIGPKILNIPEGQIDFYKMKIDTDESDLKFLVIKDKYIIGVLQNVNGEDQLLIDANGDNLLDYYSQELTIPYWVVASECNNHSNNEYNLDIYFDEAIEIFNGEVNPYSSGLHYQFTQKLLVSVSAPETPNRDIIYALYDYYNHGDQYPWVALQIINYISKTTYDRYKKDNLLFYLHTMESLINFGYSDRAIPLMEELVKKYPEFIPGLVYRWQLENDASKKEKYYKDLKTNYPNHWIVKLI